MTMNSLPSPQPLTELPRSGLLWLINRVCFHPRGLAFALHTDDEGNVQGWSLAPSPDGAVWTFPEDIDADGHARAEATLAAALASGQPVCEEAHRG